MGSPLFSLIVTSYNREQYIQETLNSILFQDFNDYELIIADDCSTDSTFQVASSYQDRFNDFKLVRNERNVGQFPNRNLAARMAMGEYILFVDSDDTLKEGTLRYLADIISIYNSIDFFIINKQFEPNGCIQMTSAEAYEYHFFQKSILHIGPGGTLIKKQLFDKIGGFPECYGVAGDMYYNLMAASKTDVLLLDNDFLNYRVHVGQEINKAYEYLVYGYHYFNDILSRNDIPLSYSKRKWLLDKSKKRFLLNTVLYAFNRKSLKVINQAIHDTSFTFSDFAKAVFS
jgi:glycosyltransferase involved in cell wall biosynthesis